MFSTRRQKGRAGRDGVWRFGTLAAIGLPATTFALAAQQETADLLAAAHERDVRATASKSAPAPLYAIKLRFAEKDAKGNERVLAEPRMIVEEGRTAEFRAGADAPVVDRAGAVKFRFTGQSVEVTIWRDQDNQVFIDGHVETSIVQGDNAKAGAARLAHSGIAFTERATLNEPVTWSFPVVLRSGPGVTATNHGTMFVELTITRVIRGPPVRGPPAAGES